MHSHWICLIICYQSPSSDQNIFPHTSAIVVIETIGLLIWNFSLFITRGVFLNLQKNSRLIKKNEARMTEQNLDWSYKIDIFFYGTKYSHHKHKKRVYNVDKLSKQFDKSKRCTHIKVSPREVYHIHVLEYKDRIVTCMLWRIHSRHSTHNLTIDITNIMPCHKQPH